MESLEVNCQSDFLSESFVTNVANVGFDASVNQFDMLVVAGLVVELSIADGALENFDVLVGGHDVSLQSDFFAIAFHADVAVEKFLLLVNNLNMFNHVSFSCKHS